jgi:hypothetical protein
MPDGSGVVVGPDRQRARNPEAHSPVDTRTVPLNTGEAAARRRSNVSTASVRSAIPLAGVHAEGGDHAEVSAAALIVTHVTGMNRPFSDKFLCGFRAGQLHDFGQCLAPSGCSI